MTSDAGYELLDAGVRRRLERFGGLTIDRPAPGAEGFRRAAAADWDAADLRFDQGAGWSGSAWPADPWPINLHGLTLELRPTTSGGVGMYPEHATTIAWLSAMVGQRTAVANEPVRVLNLFAHTGLATLALARAGADVTHVDGSRAAIGWARHNAALSGLAVRDERAGVGAALADGAADRAGGSLGANPAKLADNAHARARRKAATVGSRRPVSRSAPERIRTSDFGCVASEVAK